MSSNNTNSPPPPPPPPPGGGGGGYNDPFASGGDNGQGGQPLDDSTPSVAAAPSRVFIVLGLVLAIFTFVMFNLFVFEEGEEDRTTDEQIDITRKEQAPDIPDIGADIAPPPPPIYTPPEIPVAETPVIDPEDDGPTNELLRQRIRSSMLISGGGDDILPDAFSGSEQASDDPNLQFANRVYQSNTQAPKVTATHIGNLRKVVAQGKIIPAVLETAINTDLPGSIRGVVSRDVYPEAGDERIIPKGSRLIGQYNSSIFGGQKRVYVVWTRLIRPDGVDIMINSPLVDQIGQAGVAGQVDTKFTEIFSRALLTSVITISVAAVADQINDEEQTTTTNTDGSTTQTGDATGAAIVDQTQQIGSIADAYLRRFINVQPTILVDQGTPVNVFVNRDLIFPNQYAGARIIP